MDIQDIAKILIENNKFYNLIEELMKIKAVKIKDDYISDLKKIGNFVSLKIGTKIIKIEIEYETISIYLYLEYNDTTFTSIYIMDTEDDEKNYLYRRGMENRPLEKNTYSSKFISVYKDIRREKNLMLNAVEDNRKLFIKMYSRQITSIYRKLSNVIDADDLANDIYRYVDETYSYLRYIHHHQRFTGL